MFVTILKTNEYNELKVVDIKVGTKKKWKMKMVAMFVNAPRFQYVK
jgi:hypothetical protein